MIHYHGTPITPQERLLELAGRSFCVRYGEHRQVESCHRIGEGIMLDNGAFSLWTKGRPTDWPGYYAWCEPWLEFQTTWAVVPDVIGGSEEENDALLKDWPFGCDTGTRFVAGAPVWHMHESLYRLERLCNEWPRVCIGSSGEYATVGDARWHRRMEEAMNRLCGTGPPPVWLHMLRGMALAGSDYPFASADSTGIARNHAGNNTRGTPPRSVRAMADEIDARQCPARWQLRIPPPPLDHFTRTVDGAAAYERLHGAA